MKNSSGNLAEAGGGKKSFVLFSVESVPQTLSQHDSTHAGGGPKQEVALIRGKSSGAGGSSEKGKELQTAYNILNNHAAECGTRAWIGIGHRKVILWILKLLTSWMSSLIKFHFRQQCKLPELYFIHYINYDIQCFNQPEIKCSFQSMELSCRQEIFY